MRLFNARTKIRGVPARWHNQYPKGRAEESQLEVGRKLDALNLETASAADVDAIIGNNSWTTERCDECGAQVHEGVVLGEHTTVSICAICARVAGEAAKVLLTA